MFVYEQQHLVYSPLRIYPYLFYIEKFITQFKTTEKKNDRSPYSFSAKW